MVKRLYLAIVVASFAKVIPYYIVWRDYNGETRVEVPSFSGIILFFPYYIIIRLSRVSYNRSWLFFRYQYVVRIFIRA